MEFKETYLQRAWGDALEDVTLEDVETAIEEVQQMDEEHASFWVGIVTEDECILEVDKHLRINAILDPESGEEIHYVAENWPEVQSLFALFLEEQFEELKGKMKYWGWVACERSNESIAFQINAWPR